MSHLRVDQLVSAMISHRLDPWAKIVSEQLRHILAVRQHGDLPSWLQSVESLPVSPSSRANFSADAITIENSALMQCHMPALQRLHPWRKGPFKINHLLIDSEWRSNLKWQRLLPHVSSLEDRVILDVGCGNGYYGWRMLGEGAKLVIGIDPTWLYLLQYFAIKKLAGKEWPLFLLPIKSDEIPGNLMAFDTLFSMGVLYHRRDPIDHLIALRSSLKPGGELVLETLIVEHEGRRLIQPQGRYARMRNVWHIPSPAVLIGWLETAGFKHARTVDITPTTVEEQRGTAWMTFESLDRCLDPENPERTIEGYPAPVRAILIATV